MACVRTFATFRVFSRKHTIDELNDILGIQPTKANDRNPSSRRENEREFSIWTLSTKEALNSVDEHEHIDYLLSKLSGLATSLARLRQEGCLLDVFCYFEIDGQGGPSLAKGQMKILSELGLDIVWDIYSETR